MNLNQPNRQKLYIRRAILWANVYHSMIDAMKNTIPEIAQRSAQAAADESVKAFDMRFEYEPNQKPCSEKPKPTPP